MNWLHLILVSLHYYCLSNVGAAKIKVATLALCLINTPRHEDAGGIQVNRQAVSALTHGRTVEIDDKIGMSAALFSVLVLLGTSADDARSPSALVEIGGHSQPLNQVSYWNCKLNYFLWHKRENNFS